MPAAELARATAKAEADRIAPQDMVAILSRHFAGDKDATRRLVDGHMFLVWDAYHRFQPLPGDKRVSKLDLLGSWSVDLATAVGALTGIEPSDVEGKLRSVLAWTRINYFEEINGSLSSEKHVPNDQKPPRTAAKDRKLRTGETVNLLDDPEAPLPVFTPKGDFYRRPSRFEQDAPDEVLELREYEVELIALRQANDQQEKDARQAEANRIEPYVVSSFESAAVESLRTGVVPPNLAHTRIRQSLDRLRDRAA